LCFILESTIKGSTSLNQNIKKAPLVIFSIMICVYLPLIESWSSGTLWMVNWESPMFMDQFRNYVRVIKLILVFLGGFLLYKKTGDIRNKIVNRFVRNTFIYSSYLLLAIQATFLLLGVLFSGIFSSSFDSLHKEKNF
jgi:hypothetical protein